MTQFRMLESELRARVTLVEADSEQDVWDGNYKVIAYGESLSVETVTQDVEEVTEEDN